MTMSVLLWRAPGFPSALRKGVVGPSVDWTGLRVSVGNKAVAVTISAQRVEELLSLTREATQRNVVSRKWLLSFAGKASSFASVLVFWRPSLQFMGCNLF